MTKSLAEIVRVTKRRNLKNDYYNFTLGEYSRAAKCRPGQFFHVRLPGTDLLFRRAFSVAAVSLDRDEVEIIFKAVGRGTKIMAAMRNGEELDLLGPLGKPFKPPKRNERVVMVAGGVGFPPLLYLAASLIERGHAPERIDFCYGGRSAPDIIERGRIKNLGVNFAPVTEDGSYGETGLVTAPVERLLEASGNEGVRMYACGPMGMLKAVNDLGVRRGVPGQVSLEAPMPCGIGVCLGCVVPLVAGGHARVCREGPVFEIGEVAL